MVNFQLENQRFIQSMTTERLTNDLKPYNASIIVSSGSLPLNAILSQVFPLSSISVHKGVSCVGFPITGLA